MQMDLNCRGVKRPLLGTLGRTLSEDEWEGPSQDFSPLHQIKHPHRQPTHENPDQCADQYI